MLGLFTRFRHFMVGQFRADLRDIVREAVAAELTAREGRVPAYFRDFDFDDAALERRHWHKDQKLREARAFGSWHDHIRYALSHVSIDGLHCEFGVHDGNSMRFFIEESRATFHGFDSFYGMPEAWIGFPAGHLNRDGVPPQFPAGRVVIHQGYFADTLPGFAEAYREPLAFLHIDCDLYSSTKTVFQFLGDRIRPGTVIVFDEYITEGSDDERKAFLEFIKDARFGYRYLSRHFAGASVAAIVTTQEAMASLRRHDRVP